MSKLLYDNEWIEPIAMIVFVFCIFMIGAFFYVKNNDKRCSETYGSDWSSIGGGYESVKCVNNNGDIKGLKVTN